jgi:hypothetical protein
MEPSPGGMYTWKTMAVRENPLRQSFDYLNTEFHGADGDRPYIKWRYSSLTPDHRMGGYLPRKKLPKHVEIKPSPSAPDV